MKGQEVLFVYVMAASEMWEKAMNPAVSLSVRRLPIQPWTMVGYY